MYVCIFVHVMICINMYVYTYMYVCMYVRISHLAITPLFSAHITIVVLVQHTLKIAEPLASELLSCGLLHFVLAPHMQCLLEVSGLFDAKTKGRG